MTYRSSKSVHLCGLGVSRRIKQKKNKKGIPKKPQHVFSRVRLDHPRCRSVTWICMCGHTRDPVIYSKFHRNPFRGFGAPGGQNLAFPITLANRFYNSLYYRTSRDTFTVVQRMKLQHTGTKSLRLLTYELEEKFPKFEI